MHYQWIERLCRLFEQDKGLVLSFIIQSTGSAPRKQGTAMLFDSKGNYYFSVGGGIIEKTAMQDAQAMIDNLLAYEGNEGMRGFIKGLSGGISMLECDDPGILINLNTEEDYNEICQRAVMLPDSQ